MKFPKDEEDAPLDKPAERLRQFDEARQPQNPRQENTQTRKRKKEDESDESNKKEGAILDEKSKRNRESSGG